MNFAISGKHIVITDAIRAYAEEKTSKLSRYYDGVNQVEVVVDSSHGANKMSVEIIARGEHGHVFIATEMGEVPTRVSTGRYTARAAASQEKGQGKG